MLRSYKTFGVLKTGLSVRSTIKARVINGSQLRFNSGNSLKDKIEKEHSVDASELFSDRITSTPYYAKREHPQNEHVKQILKERQQAWDNHELAQTEGIKILSEQEQRDRMEKMTRLNSLFQGALVLAVALGLAYYFTSDNMSFLNKHSSLIDEEKIEQKLNINNAKKDKKLKKISAQLTAEAAKGQQLISNKSNHDLVQWKDGKANTLTAFSVGNGKKDLIRDVVECGEALLYVNKRGDLYKLSTNSEATEDLKNDTLILKDQQITKLKSTSDNQIIAQTSKNEILVIPLTNSKYKEYVSSKRSKLLPWKHYDGYSKKLPFSFESYDLGESHFIGIGVKDKLVYTCSLVSPENVKHKGQFGLPKYAPIKICDNEELARELKPFDVENVELLNYLIKNDCLQERQFAKVACGKYHTVAMDTKGDIYTFGNNTFGQLGVNVSYDTENIPYPKQLRKLPQLSRDKSYDWECQDIKCGDYTTYLKVKDENDSKYTYFKLGNSHFKSSQQAPTKMKYDLQDCIKEWEFQGSQCALVNSKNELYVWGSNNENSLPGILPNKNYAYPIDTGFKLEPNARVLVTKHNGTIIY
ncbi:hypothetical protein ACO0QE_003497 [Hanseniaspora vineae]